MKKNVIATQTRPSVFPNAVKRTATLCGKPLNREGGVKNLCCLSEASYIDFSRLSVKFNERSARSLDFWFFLSRKRTEKFLIN